MKKPSKPISSGVVAGGRLLMALFLLLVMPAALTAQDNEEIVEEIRIRTPGYLGFGTQNFANDVSLFAVYTSYSRTPRVIRDAYDRDGNVKDRIRAEFVEFGWDAVTTGFTSAANIFSLRYAGSTQRNQERGFGLYSKTAFGPGLYVSDAGFGLVLSLTGGGGFGVDFRRFGLGIQVQSTVGGYFIDGTSSFYYGFSMGLYGSSRRAIAPDRVRDLPEPEDEEV